MRGSLQLQSFQCRRQTVQSRSGEGRRREASTPAMVRLVALPAPHLLRLLLQRQGMEAVGHRGLLQCEGGWREEEGGWQEGREGVRAVQEGVQAAKEGGVGEEEGVQGAKSVLKSGGEVCCCEEGAQRRSAVEVRRQLGVQERGVQGRGVEECLCGSGIPSWRGGNGSRVRSERRRFCGMGVWMESAEVGRARSKILFLETADSRAPKDSSETPTPQVGCWFFFFFSSSYLVPCTRSPSSRRSGCAHPFPGPQLSPRQPRTAELSSLGGGVFLYLAP